MKDISQDKSESARVVRVTDLAAKFGIKPVNGKFDVGCPGVTNPFETVAIETTWGHGGANADETDRFDQFSSVLNAIEYAAERAEYGNYRGATFDHNKILYTALNVYGRAMFAHIIEKYFKGSIRTSAFLEVAYYASEGLDFNATCYDNNVGSIFKSYIANSELQPFLAGILKSRETSHLAKQKLEQKLNIPDVTQSPQQEVKLSDSAAKQQQVDDLISKISFFSQSDKNNPDAIKMMSLKQFDEIQALVEENQLHSESFIELSHHID